jgi:glutaminyl-peptide cyclotransferase
VGSDPKRGALPACLLALALVAAVAGCGRRERTFDSARAWHHLEAQMEAGPRVPGSEGHRRTLEYLVDQLEGKADRVDVHAFAAVSPLDSSAVTYRNVVAVFGQEHKLRILFGAHWDTRPVADQETDPALRDLPVPGANDGASGVAVLLAVAEALAAVPPRVGVDLVFFDGEDSGIADQPETFALGSRRFVADHPTYRPAMVVILDMVGRRGTRIPREANSLTAAPGAVAMVWRTAAELGIASLVDSVGAGMYDDHVAFLRAGIPAVDLIDPADPAWHTTRDVADNCSQRSLDDMGRLVLGLVARAESGLRP